MDQSNNAEKMFVLELIVLASSITLWSSLKEHVEIESDWTAALRWQIGS